MLTEAATEKETIHNIITDQTNETPHEFLLKRQAEI